MNGNDIHETQENAVQELHDAQETATHSAAALVDAGGLVVQAFATGVAQAAGGVAGVMAATLTAPWTAAATVGGRAQVDEPTAEDEGQEAAEPVLEGAANDGEPR